MKSASPLLALTLAILLFHCHHSDGIIPEPSASGGIAGKGGSSDLAGSAGSAGSAGAGFAGSSGSVAGSAGQLGSAGGQGIHCPADLPGPTLVEIPTTDGFSSYCIDATEVTQSQYQAFLEAKKDDVSGQIKECVTNSTFTPPTPNPNAQEEGNRCILSGNWSPQEHPNWPVDCVDWCDAAAYCTWSGKRLCGRIGGGAVENDMEKSAQVNQWVNACSQGGKTKYAYGNDYQADRCVLAKSPEPKDDASRVLSEVQSHPDCHGSEGVFTRLYDLIGNVSEWQDDFMDVTPAPGEGDPYRIYRWGGGGIADGGDLKGQDCSDAGYNPRMWSSVGVGFRCCKD